MMLKKKKKVVCPFITRIFWTLIPARKYKNIILFPKNILLQLAINLVDLRFGSGIRKIHILILTSALTTCVILENLLNLSENQLKSRGNYSTYHILSLRLDSM